MKAIFLFPKPSRSQDAPQMKTFSFGVSFLNVTKSLLTCYLLTERAFGNFTLMQCKGLSLSLLLGMQPTTCDGRLSTLKMQEICKKQLQMSMKSLQKAIRSPSWTHQVDSLQYGATKSLNRPSLFPPSQVTVSLDMQNKSYSLHSGTLFTMK